MNGKIITYIIVFYGFSWILAGIIWQMGGLEAKGENYLLFPIGGFISVTILTFWVASRVNRKDALTIPA